MKYFNILFITTIFFSFYVISISSYPNYIKISLSDNYYIPFSLHNSFTYFLNVNLQDNKLGVNETIFDQLQQDSEFLHYKIFYDDSCYLTSISNQTYHFSLYFKDCGNVFGLGRSSEMYYKYSILHALYEKKIITKRQFSLELTANKKEQFLYLGEFPYDIKHFSSINTFEINQNSYYIYDNSWGFCANKIESNGSVYDLNKTLIFSLSGENSLITQDIFIWLSKNVFNPYIQDNRCKIDKYFSWEYIICDMDVYQHLPKLNFIQGNSTFEYTIRNDSKGRVDIAYNPILDDDDEIIYLRTNGFIGKIISFNSDSQTITVYSDYNLNELNKCERIRIYIYIIDLISIFGIINCLLCYIHKYFFIL